MAGKDFARIEATASDDEVKEERPARHTSMLLWLGLWLAVVMGAFSGGFWFGKIETTETTTHEEKARLQALIQKQKSALESLRLLIKKRPKAAKASMRQVGDLMFYNDFPKQSVTPSALHQVEVNSQKEKKHSSDVSSVQKVIRQKIQEQPVFKPRQHEVTPIRKEQTKVSLVHYQIQLASFQKRPDAVQFSHKMGAKGIGTRIQKMKLPKLGTWYRVYTGNYMDKKQAMKALLKLKDSIHVTGLVVNR